MFRWVRTVLNLFFELFIPDHSYVLLTPGHKWRFWDDFLALHRLLRKLVIATIAELFGRSFLRLRFISVGFGIVWGSALLFWINSCCESAPTSILRVWRLLAWRIRVTSSHSELFNCFFLESFFVLLWKERIAIRKGAFLDWILKLCEEIILSLTLSSLIKV